MRAEYCLDVLYVIEWCIESGNQQLLSKIGILIERLTVGCIEKHGRLKCSNFLHLTS